MIRPQLCPDWTKQALYYTNTLNNTTTNTKKNINTDSITNTNTNVTQGNGEC